MTNCDFPGCRWLAVHIAQGQGANTPPKEWFGCDLHRAVSIDESRLESWVTRREEHTQ